MLWLGQSLALWTTFPSFPFLADVVRNCFIPTMHNLIQTWKKPSCMLDVHTNSRGSYIELMTCLVFSLADFSNLCWTLWHNFQYPRKSIILFQLEDYQSKLCFSHHEFETVHLLWFLSGLICNFCTDLQLLGLVLWYLLLMAQILAHYPPKNFSKVCYLLLCCKLKHYPELFFIEHINKIKGMMSHQTHVHLFHNQHIFLN